VGTLAGHPADLWIFAYGSLMWRPDFQFAERARATVVGYHRAFCVASTMHRGTRARPGLVLGLDRGKSCEGVAYRVGAGDVAAVVAYLRQRELIYGVYREAHVPAVLAEGASTRATPVLAYTVERFHPSYTGGLALSEQARVIRAARGRSGANLDYLINTVRHLQALGIRERGLERLMSVAAAHTASATSTELHRPCVAALRATWAQRPSPDVRVPQGDQRRFGHRVRLAG
jgi:glutathione-specific gamma-glutamylcyclotransferase